jgi:putative nucleic acid binding protein
MRLSKKYGIFLLLIIIAGLSIYGLYCYSRSRSRILVTPDLSLTAAAFADSFDIPEGRADSLFLYKTIALTGVVQSLYQSGTGHLVVGLFGRMSSSVTLDCYLDSLHLQVQADLKPGDNVVIKGRYTGRSNNIVFDQCIIEK